jgi:hypothetical protein
MTYVCLIYIGEKELDALPKSAFDARVAECLSRRLSDALMTGARSN